MFAAAGYPVTAEDEMTDELMSSHVLVAEEEAELAVLSEILAGA
jgi:hypothetical protein